MSKFITAKIETKCPSCHNATLALNEDGQLFCTWVDCKDPVLIHKWGNALGAPTITPPTLEQFPTLDTNDEELKAVSICVQAIERHIKDDKAAQDRVTAYLHRRFL